MLVVRPRDLDRVGVGDLGDVRFGEDVDDGERDSAERPNRGVPKPVRFVDPVQVEELRGPPAVDRIETRKMVSPA